MRGDMALPVLPNASNFVGVALVLNEKNGPRFVFHYPPHILPVQKGRQRGKTEDEWDLEDEEDLVDRLARPEGPSFNPTELPDWNQDDHVFTESGTQIVPWEHVAGYPTSDLQGILTPGRAYHKRLFQLSLDGLFCVSYPIYVPENGVWKKKKKSTRDETVKDGKKTSGEEGMPADADAGAGNGDTNIAETDGVEVKDMATKTEGPADNVEVEEKKSSMIMFNLVFILKPQKHETNDLVDVMFTHIIKKVNKAYKYCQQRGEFVWKESKKIIALKDKAFLESRSYFQFLTFLIQPTTDKLTRLAEKKMTALWNDILATSSLAASMQDLYDAISQNKIAVLQLDSAEGTVTHSVQIPVPFHVSDVTSERDTDAKGLWLTTANTLMDHEDDGEDLGYLDKNFALLLMEDEKKIMSELQADADEATLSMIEFVKHCKPTLSFHQVGQQSSNILSPTQVRKYAQHFIFWRRAIAIPPLHARDIYTLSPNSDLSRLPQAAARWARQFPLAPALPNFLADLSVAPRPYKLYCPSKAHRPIYMTMLAWLMRGGWVMQLCTFAYVVVWPEIIYEVEYALEAEEIAKAKRAQAEGGDPGSLGSNTTATSSSSASTEATGPAAGIDPRSFSEPFNNPNQQDLSSSTATLRDLTLSPTQSNSDHALSPTRSSSSQFLTSPSRTATSPTQTRTTSPIQTHQHNHNHNHPTPTPAERAAEKARLERLASRAAQTLADKATAHARKTPPKSTAHPSVNDAPHLAQLSPHIILDAKKATGRESLYLDAIGRRLAKGPTKVPHEKDHLHPHHHHLHHHHGHHHHGQHHKGGVPTNGSSSDKGGGKESSGSSTPEAASKEWAGRVAGAWPSFWKYFNGRCSMERIALQEDMKRKDAWNLLTAMSEYLLTVRHW